MEIYSCDSMIAPAATTSVGHAIFAKNTDRPLYEAQPLVLYESSDHDAGDLVQCTYIKIPQVSRTYRVIGSKPYWLWGFEMGVNEFTVAIGNEAEWSKDSVESEDGLIGMDLVRLGLERSTTADGALSIITNLLEKYGQGGNAAVGFEHRYHNSFVIADAKKAWILETSGRRWIARKVDQATAISNCYSIGVDWDLASDDIKEHAYINGWTNVLDRFNFAEAYSRSDLHWRASFPRYQRMSRMLAAKTGGIDVEFMKSILRDHFEGELIEPRLSPGEGLFTTICMHNFDQFSSKTVASAVIELNVKYGPVYWCCFSNPCTSAYMPIYMTGCIPEAVVTADGSFGNGSLWWLSERLNEVIHVNYSKYASWVIPQMKVLEATCVAEAKSIERQVEVFLIDGKRKSINELLTQFMKANCESLYRLTKTLHETISDDIRKNQQT